MFIFKVILLTIVLAFVVWLGWRTLKQSDAPGVLILKWVFSAITFIPVIFLARYLKGLFEGGAVDYLGAYIGGGSMAVIGLVYAIIWRGSIVEMIAKPFTMIYDGGGGELEAQPFYAIAFARRKRGKYTEAIRLIREQLEKFPTDFAGQFAIAEMQAENLNDLPGAELTMQRLCAQAVHPQRSIVSALNALADWQMRYGQDRDAARLTLEQIMARYPDTEAAALAAQRIGHLAENDHLLSGYERKKYIVSEGAQNLGLLGAEHQPRAPQVDLAKQADEFVRHLQAHPLDTEARERLALIYAQHYGRLDLATEQLEQLISHSGQPLKRVVHWLNVLADLQVRYAADYELARVTLQRIIELCPNGPAAQIATNRIMHLKLEFKAKEESRAVKLGSYEKDIGLSGGSGKAI